MLWLGELRRSARHSNIIPFQWLLFHRWLLHNWVRVRVRVRARARVGVMVRVSKLTAVALSPDCVAAASASDWPLASRLASSRSVWICIEIGLELGIRVRLVRVRVRD
jgi:hypothetical protein